MHCHTNAMCFLHDRMREICEAAGKQELVGKREEMETKREREKGKKKRTGEIFFPPECSSTA